MIFNPLDKKFKSITGAIKENEELTLRVKGNYQFVTLVLHKDYEDIEKEIVLIKKGIFFECIFSLNIGLYWYYFKTDNGIIILGDNYQGKLEKETNLINCFQLSVYDKNYKVPEWLKGGIIYQIFPDRFCKFGEIKELESTKILHKNLNEDPFFLPDNTGKVLNNDFYGGNLKGIENKLEYLKSLNVKAIYLNPIYKAYSNHRYDIGNYFEIDSLLGSDEDFISLINKADKLGIKIIIDGVFNHTGSDRLYFNKNGRYKSIGAYQSKNSKYYNWYKFIQFPDNYESWWGIQTLPATNKENSDYINFITGTNGVLNHYLKMGVFGVRLDVVDELPEEFVEKIRERIKIENSSAILIGEVWEDASNKISYGKRRKYFLGKELDSVMNYPLKNAIIKYVKYSDDAFLLDTIKQQIDHYPREVLFSLMNILSTHDTFRIASELSCIKTEGKSKEELAKEKIKNYDKSSVWQRVKIASLLMYSLYGVASIYYGDEIGMEGFYDPLNRKYFEWNKIGNELNEWYKLLGKFREKYSCLGCGDFKEIYFLKGIVIFKVVDDKCEVLVAINKSNEEVICKFSGDLKNIIEDKIYHNMFTLKKDNYGLYINEI